MAGWEVLYGDEGYVRVEDLSVKLKQRRLRWFGHVKRTEGILLKGVEEVMIGGRWPVARPKKKWIACLIEDINTLGIEEHIAQDHQLWKAVITHPTPCKWEIRNAKQ